MLQIVSTPIRPSLSLMRSIEEDKKNGLDGHNPWNEAAKKLEEETLQTAYGVERIEELPFNYVGYRMQKGEEHEAEIYKKHYGLLKDIAQQTKQYLQEYILYDTFYRIAIFVHGTRKFERSICIGNLAKPSKNIGLKNNNF